MAEEHDSTETAQMLGHEISAANRHSGDAKSTIWGDNIITEEDPEQVFAELDSILTAEYSFDTSAHRSKNDISNDDSGIQNVVVKQEYVDVIEYDNPEYDSEFVITPNEDSGQCVGGGDNTTQGEQAVVLQNSRNYTDDALMDALMTEYYTVEHEDVDIRDNPPIEVGTNMQNSHTDTHGATVIPEHYTHNDDDLSINENPAIEIEKDTNIVPTQHENIKCALVEKVKNGNDSSIKACHIVLTDISQQSTAELKQYEDATGVINSSNEHHNNSLKNPDIQSTYRDSNGKACRLVLRDLKHTIGTLTPQSSMVISDLPPQIELDVCKDEQLDTVSTMRSHLGKHNAASTYRRKVKLVCNVCGFDNARTPSALKRHMRVHTNEKPYTCTYCKRAFKQKGDMLKHTRTHTGEIRYKCDTCGSLLADKVSLQRHMYKHIGYKPFQCTKCPAGFTCSNHLRRHELIHSGSMPFECVTCGKKFIDSAALAAHDRSHSGVQPYSCDLCKRKFSFNGNLKRHMRRHTGEKLFLCTNCPYKCVDAGSLKIHNRTHTKETPYKCDECDYRCGSSGALIAHRNKHRIEKKHKCKECNFRSNHASSLKNHVDLSHNKHVTCKFCGYVAIGRLAYAAHMKKHVKMYKCVFCKYRANKPSTVKIHLLTHTNQKPFKCDQCDYTARRKCHIQSHLRTHTKQKPYKCSFCSYTSSQSSSMNKHIKKHSLEKCHTCSKCSYSTPSLSALNRHMRSYCTSELEKSE